MNGLHVLLFLVSVFCFHDTFALQDERVLALMKDRSRYARVRCTRRYTAGNCVQAVAPVWSYVAPLQTCTERLGCPASVYTNRFNTYGDCMMMCRELKYLFMFLQSSMSNNDTFKVPTDGAEPGIWSMPELNAMYHDVDFNEMIQAENESLDDTDDESSNIDDEREFKNAISALRAGPDYPEEASEEPSEEPTKATSDRPPMTSRKGFILDSELIVPDIDKFP